MLFLPLICTDIHGFRKSTTETQRETTDFRQVETILMVDSHRDKQDNSFLFSLNTRILEPLNSRILLFFTTEDTEKKTRQDKQDLFIGILSAPTDSPEAKNPCILESCLSNSILILPSDHEDRISVSR